MKIPHAATKTQGSQINRYGFEKKNGYFTISGVLPGGEDFDFDQNNMDKWEVYEIGIWDSFDETLYYISITKQ